MAGPWDDYKAKGSTDGKPWEEFGATPEKPKGPGAIRKAGDLAVGLVGGAVGATKALTDVAGAGNPASNFLDSANKDIDSLLSPQAQADKQEQSAIMKEAEGKGTYEGVKAGLKAFAVAPVQTTMSGIGSVIPVAAATMATGGGAIPAMAAGAATGAAMGAGTVKGAIYDDIKERSLAAGMTPEAAEAAATKAQAYGGGNTDQIALGAGLGMLDAATGVTPIVANMARKAVGREAVKALTTNTGKGLLRRTATGTLEEMPLEAAQGGQEQLAANLAAQRAGYQAGTWDNVASNATLEGLASAGPGAGFGALSGGQKPATPSPAPPAPQEPTAPQTEPGAPQLGYNPMAGTHTVFPDGSIVLNSESSNGAKTVRDMQRNNRLEKAALGDLPPELVDAFEQSRADAKAKAGLWSVLPVEEPVKPSEAMGLAPTAGPSLANAAILSVDSGIHQAATEAADPYNAPLSALGQELSRTNQRLRQEADALGLDTEGLHGDAARMTDGKSHEDYLMAANDQLRKAMKAAKEIPHEGQRSGSDDPAPGSEAKGPDAQAGKAPAGDAGGAVRAGAVRPATDRVGEHGQRPAGTDGRGLPGAVAAPTRDQAIAKASDAAGKVLASGGTDADANRAATDSLIDQMAATPGIAIAQDAPAAVKAAKVKPPANNNAQTTTSAPSAPAAGLPAAGSDPVQADGVKGKQEFQIGGKDPHTRTYDHRSDGRLVRAITYPDGQSATETLVTDKKGDEVWVSNDRYGKGEFYPVQLSLDEAETATREDMADKPLSSKPQPQGALSNVSKPAELGTQASQAPSAQGAAPAGTAIAPKFSLDHFGWNPKKLSEAYNMEQLNSLYQEVRSQFSNKVVGGGPVDENGMATKESLNAEGTKMHNSLKKAIGIVYAKNKESQSSTPTSNGAAVASPAGPGAVKRTAPPNSVIRDVRDFDGNKLGDIVVPHDGTKEGVLKAAIEANRQMNEQYGHAATHAGSRIGATDANGQPAWAISPNLAHVEPYGTREADYIFGDLSAAPVKDSAPASPGKQKALDRIASGKAWFGSGPKAQQFIAQNGLKDTHTVKKTSATRFDVVANETQPVTQGATSEPQADQAQQTEAQRPQEPAAAAEPVAERTATEHAGLKIYPTKVKIGDTVVDMWGVQTPDNARREKNGERQIGGDPLSETLEGAKKNAEAAMRDAKDRSDREAESKAADDAAQAKKDANKGKSILQRRADALLDKQHTYPPQAGLGQGTRREAMQKAVDQGRAIVKRMVPDTAAKHRDQTAIDLVKARGFILGLSNENIPVVKQGLEAKARMKANQYEKPEYRVYDSAKTDGGFYEITKTEFDYAKSLEAKAPEVGDFGPILTQYRGDAQGAIKALTELQDGEAVAALNHPEVGDIDLVWGVEGTRESNGHGLAKLVKWHPEILADLQGVISSLKIVQRTENRIQLESEAHKAAVRLEWDGKAKHWLLTAFEKKDAGGGTRTDTTAIGVEDDTARLKSSGQSVAQTAESSKATHQDPGAAPEAATAPVIAESLQKAAKKEERPLAEMKAELLGMIDAAVKETPNYKDYLYAVEKFGKDAAEQMYARNDRPMGMDTVEGKGRITFDVPGDGKFTVVNSYAGLMAFRAKIAKASGNGFSETKRPSLPASTSVKKGSTNQISAIESMLEDGDLQAAKDYMAAVGISTEGLKKSALARMEQLEALGDSAQEVLYTRIDPEWQYSVDRGSRRATLTRTIGKDVYRAYVIGGTRNDVPDDFSKATYGISKNGKKDNPDSAGNFHDALVAVQSSLDKLAEKEGTEIQATPASKAKDTGWSMAGTGYAGKRYSGRNMTLDDGREVVARIYENAGVYEEAEVKVDGKRVFAVTDRNDAQGKADDFIKTLTRERDESVEAFKSWYNRSGHEIYPSKKSALTKWMKDGIEGLYDMPGDADPAPYLKDWLADDKGAPAELDLMGFTKTPTGNGTFTLSDSNMRVTVEPTGAGFQARMGSGTSGPRLTEQQAIEWAASMRDESIRIQKEEAKKKPEAKQETGPTAEQIAAIGDITIDVPTENGTAKMTVNAAKALASIDERLEALKMVQRCLA